MKVFGDQERVLVDGIEPGTVVDSPSKHCYRIQLDSGGVIERMGATLRPMPTSYVDRRLPPWQRMNAIAIAKNKSGRWTMTVLGRDEKGGGATLFEVPEVTLDCALEALALWRKGIVIV